MSLSRPLVALIGVGVLGIAIVGAGAGATFTDATHSLQSINTGTINVTLNSPDDTWGNDTKSIGFANINLTGSTFQDAPRSITMKNNGTIAAKYVYFNIATTSPAIPSTQDTQLASELNVCIWSPAGTAGALLYDGPVSSFYASPGGLGLPLTGGSLEPQATDSYSVEFYAGDVLTKCGQSVGGAALSQEAMGGSVTTSVDITYEG